jgi:galactose mutarotase-like enzyme
MMKLENQHLQISLIAQSAQIRHMIDRRTGHDWIWSGDPKFWPQHNPILFPIVGSTHDGVLRWPGHATRSGNHGFTRYSDFSLVRQTADQIDLRLVDSEATRAEYPFTFELLVQTRLVERSVEIVYTITNTGDQIMPFSFGLHPAFATHHNGVSGSIHLRFSSPEPDMERSVIDRKDPRVVRLDDAFFERHPTFILTAPTSQYVELVEPTGTLRVSIQGYRWLAFWKKPKAPFICIEPWHGHDDFGLEKGLFQDREGTLWLSPQRHFISSVRYQLIEEERE